MVSAAVFAGKILYRDILRCYGKPVLQPGKADVFFLDAINFCDPLYRLFSGEPLFCNFEYGIRPVYFLDALPSLVLGKEFPAYRFLHYKILLREKRAADPPERIEAFHEYNLSGRF